VKSSVDAASGGGAPIELRSGKGLDYLEGPCTLRGEKPSRNSFGSEERGGALGNLSELPMRGWKNLEPAVAKKKRKRRPMRRRGESLKTEDLTGASHPAPRFCLHLETNRCSFFRGAGSCALFGHPQRRAGGRHQQEEFFQMKNPSLSQGGGGTDRETLATRVGGTLGGRGNQLPLRIKFPAKKQRSGG